MRRDLSMVFRIAAAGLLLTLLPTAHRLAAAGGSPPEADNHPSVVFHEAPLVQMPGVELPGKPMRVVDSHSPLHWDGDTLYLFNNLGHPWRASGKSLTALGSQISTDVGWQNNKMHVSIVSTWKDEDGTLYGAYHYKPVTTCFSNAQFPTAPRIGWLRSRDNGATWDDLGYLIAADPCQLNCQTRSPWYAGGAGDFGFLLDQKKEFFYFYGTSYDPRLEEQGIFAARLAYADRDNPVGKVKKWHKGAWSEPGWWGHVTPVFPAARDFTQHNGAMFWGPAIHWNTYLNTYVMLLNRASDPKLASEGIYLSFNRDLGDPNGWSKPQRILDREGILRATTTGKIVGGTMLLAQNTSAESLGDGLRGAVVASADSLGWYPQVVGTAPGETDKLCGRTARFFVNGISALEISFLKPGEQSP
jgi:hypothetical protein